MQRRSRLPIGLALVTAVCAGALYVGTVAPGSSVAGTTATPGCVRGSWVANTAEANRFIQRIFSSPANLRVQRGALSATFADGKLTYGGYSIVLVGGGGGSDEMTIKNTVDLIAKAPYRVAGNRLILGAGKYRRHYVSVVLSLGGHSLPSKRPADLVTTMPGGSVPLTCSGNTLRWKMPLPVGSAGTWLTFRRDR